MKCGGVYHEAYRCSTFFVFYVLPVALMVGLLATAASIATPGPHKKPPKFPLNLFAEATPDDYSDEKDCVRCHRTAAEMFERSPHTLFMKDPHLSLDKQGCQACHGPSKPHVAHRQESEGLYTYVISYLHSTPEEIATACLRCHSGAFRALNVDEPLSQGQTPTQVDAAITKLSTATLQSYIPVTHATATCTNCHNPHANTANLTSASEQFFLRRATSSLDTTGVGPNVPVATYSTFNHICGSCHNNRGGDPSDAGLQKNTTRPATHEGPEYNMLVGEGGAEDAAGPPVRRSTHSAAPDQCIQCHMPNSRYTFTVSLDISCSPCHTPDDAAARESSVQTEIQNDLVALRMRMENWAQQTFGDPAVWDYTSNIPTTSKTPNQTLIPIEVKRARHNYYFVLLDRSLGVHNTPYARYLINYANSGLDKLGIAQARSVMSRQQIMAILNSDIYRVRVSNAHSNGY